MIETQIIMNLTPLITEISHFGSAMEHRMRCDDYIIRFNHQCMPNAHFVVISIFITGQ